MIPDHVRDRFALAYEVASTSLDPRTQNGVVLELPSGHDDLIVACNDPVKGQSVLDDDFGDKKYLVMEHAERNAIYHAASGGHRTFGATLYAPWASCSDCARAIVASGIQVVHRHIDAIKRTPDHWQYEVKMGYQILVAGGVQVNDHQGEVGGHTIRFDGEAWTP